MTVDKGIQIVWNTAVGITFLAALGVTMVANRLVGRS